MRFTSSQPIGRSLPHSEVTTLRPAATALLHLEFLFRFLFFLFLELEFLFFVRVGEENGENAFYIVTAHRSEPSSFRSDDSSTGCNCATPPRIPLPLPLLPLPRTRIPLLRPRRRRERRECVLHRHSPSVGAFLIQK